MSEFKCRILRCCKILENKCGECQLLRFFLVIIVEEELTKEEEEQKNWLTRLVNSEFFYLERESTVFFFENTRNIRERRSRERKKLETNRCIIRRVPRRD